MAGPSFSTAKPVLGYPDVVLGELWVASSSTNIGSSDVRTRCTLGSGAFPGSPFLGMLRGVEYPSSSSVNDSRLRTGC